MTLCCLELPHSRFGTPHFDAVDLTSPPVFKEESRWPTCESLALCIPSALPHTCFVVFRTFDIMWREAMMELLDQLEAENPTDVLLAPKDLSEWACIYIRYIQILRKLELSYDQMVHPQKRLDMRKALEACIGRTLEIRHWMVKLNRGLDFVSLDDILVDLKVGTDKLDCSTHGSTAQHILL